MKWKLAGLAGVLTLSLELYAPPPVDACGVKLAFKMQRPRKGIAKSGKPSNLLLVGSPPKRLQHDLSSAGHSVETVASAADAKRQSYEVVVVASSDQASLAREKFPGATVVVRSGDVTADVRTVESQIGRRPVLTASRDVVAAGPEKPKPVAASPTTEDRKLTAAKTAEQPKAAGSPTATAAAAAAPPPPAPTPAPTPAPAPPAEKVAATVTAPPEQAKPPKEPAAVKTSATLAKEVYFTLGSSTLSNKTGLDKAAEWLKANDGIHATIEGHANPSGSADKNMTLSQARAEFVRDYLVSTGIDSGRLEVKPLGDTKLKYGKKDARNRRVLVDAKK